MDVVDTVYVYIYVCMYVCSKQTHAYIYTYTHVYLLICIHIYMAVFTYFPRKLAAQSSLKLPAAAAWYHWHRTAELQAIHQAFQKDKRSYCDESFPPTQQGLVLGGGGAGGGLSR